MSLKKNALAEIKALQRDFGISPSRLGRELFNDPTFVSRLRKPETRVTDVSLDRIFKYAVELRGQQRLPLDASKKASDE